ncbi:MAG: hypothetical protein IKW59_02565 [Clostridia bacterium]|nr:hypothetical protein [Clostridia bacterium]
MTELKSTKIALVTGIVSLVLSFTMLLGTTYAWLIDSVSSADNRILAGNLDVDLLMYKADKESYVSISETNGDIFAEANGGDDVNWEPDKTEIVYLAVENIGELALKYSIKLNISGKLAGVLDYAVLEDVKADDISSENWAEIKNNQKAKTGKLKEGLISVVSNGKLKQKDDKDYFAVSVHMPDNAANNFQGNSIVADLTLVATQSAYEEDSFGKNYDKKAEYTENEAVKKSASEMNVVTIGTIEEFKEFTQAVNSDDTFKEANVANNPDVYVKLTDNIDLSEYPDFAGIGDGKDNSFDGVFDGCGHIIKNRTADNSETQLALFASTNGAEVKNLTIDNFNLGTDTDKGNDCAFLIGSITGGDVLIDNITVKNSTITAQGPIGVIVGTMSEGRLTITNCNIKYITIKNAEEYKDAVGILLGSVNPENDNDEISFKESENKFTDVKWFNADKEQKTIPVYNYTK